MIAKYELLTEEQRDFLSGGCGPEGHWVFQGWWWRPFRWALVWLLQDFAEACRRHDVAYEIGGDGSARVHADRTFCAQTQAAARKTPWWRRWVMRKLAQRACELVYRYGHLTYVQKRPLTIEQIEARMSEA
jgi:hypothetical protein